MLRHKSLSILALSLVSLVSVRLSAQAQDGQPAAPANAQAAAVEDLTGYWVSIVTEDWRYRMMTPAKGDYASVPLTPEGKKVADTWDPVQDAKSGSQCKAYAAPGIMRIPGRIHITWDNPDTLKIETDSGKQTRLFHFTAISAQAPSLQGTSHAVWQPTGAERGVPVNPRALQQIEGGGGGSLKVTTTNLLPGYLRSNGVPFSANAVVTEYYTKTMEPNGDLWLIITTIVNDPLYLRQPFLTSSNFKKQADNTGWDPSPCSAH